jgi:hypothetical protein
MSVFSDWISLLQTAKRVAHSDKPQAFTAKRSTHVTASYAARAAFFSAQRFFWASAIALRPAALSVPFGFTGLGMVTASPRTFAHLRCCASRMRFKAAALNLRLVLPLLGAAAALLDPLPVNIARNSAIWASIFFLWPSKPAIAASMISFVSVGNLKFSLYFKM